MSPTTNASSRRSSYMPLSVKPIDYSLTAGTDIPAPLDSPPESPASSVSNGRPPTSGGGPLTSHPTNSRVDLAGAFPPSPDPENQSLKKAPSSSANSHARHTPADSFRTPISPASATPMAPNSPEYPQPNPRRASGVRKLLSLSSLRSSFSSSRTSLALPNDAQQPPQAAGTKRPSSPSMASSADDSSNQQPQPRQPLRHKKSGGNWFRRKSSMFMMNLGSTDALNEADENSRPETRESKKLKTMSTYEPTVERYEPVAERQKERTPPPMLPQFDAGLSGGDMGWDENMFKR